MGFFDNMRKPQGKLGNFQLKSMNKEHTPLSLWGLTHLNIKPEDIILDVGCGGGINIKRMAENAKKVYGIETVYFWPDIEKCFGEVKRVLKPGGIFLIGMETNGSDNFIMKFWKHFIDMEMYTDNEIKAFLENNDYSQITAYLRLGKSNRKIIKSNGSQKIVDDDYTDVSFSARFLQWVTIVARK